MPLRDKVAEARLARLAAELEEQKESANLEAFVELIEKLQSQIDVDATTLAAILLQRQQGKRPLFYNGPDPMISALERENQRRDRRREDRGGERQPQYNAANWDTYQLQVGREQGVQVKDIVGAIANELGLDKQNIGSIKLASAHTYVQLPKQMPKEILQQLRQLRIRQKATDAQLVEGHVNMDPPRRRNNHNGDRNGNRRFDDRGGQRHGNGERRFNRDRGGDRRSFRGERRHSEA